MTKGRKRARRVAATKVMRRTSDDAAPSAWASCGSLRASLGHQGAGRLKHPSLVTDQVSAAARRRTESNLMGHNSGRAGLAPAEGLLLPGYDGPGETEDGNEPPQQEEGALCRVERVGRADPKHSESGAAAAGEVVRLRCRSGGQHQRWAIPVGLGCTAGDSCRSAISPKQAPGSPSACQWSHAPLGGRQASCHSLESTSCDRGGRAE